MTGCFAYRHYYGYQWRWWLLAEAAWRLEHLPWSYEGQVFAPLARAAYGWRKAAERRGYAAGH